MVKQMQQMDKTEVGTAGRSFLQLVNAAHPVEGAPPEPLRPALPGSKQRLCRTPAVMLGALLQKTEADGLVTVVSGYRENSEQRHIHTQTAQQHGEKFAAMYVARPGCSEHETGLAVDLAADAGQIDFIRPHLPDDGVYKTLRALAPRYGYIQRYTQEKTAVTGIGDEPWHFRYVGWPHAEIISKEGLALEEYIEKIKHFTHPGEAFGFHLGGRAFSIFTAGVAEVETYRQQYHAEGTLCQYSSNNAGGVVVTVWH